MAFFDWKDEYSIGISVIDRQHRKILELINDLFESIRDAREDLIIKEVLDDLVDYSHYHFGLEKKLFDQYRYPRAEEHEREHYHFIDKLTSLMIGASLNKACVPLETMDYLRQWFSNHMVGVDRGYSSFFREIDKLEEIEEQYRNA